MIVAAAARHGEAEKGRGRGFRQVRHPRGFGFVLLVEELGGTVPRTDAQVAGGDEAILLCGITRGAGHHFIAGELLTQKAVERLVRVERADHVVAIPPRLLAKFVPVVAVAVGIAHQVQPPAGPVLGERSRGDEPVHEAVRRVRGGVIHESLQRFRRRGQPRQIKKQPPSERLPVRLRRGFQACGLQAGKDEPVQFLPRPIFGLHLRQSRRLHRTQRPVVKPRSLEQHADGISRVRPCVANALIRRQRCRQNERDQSNAGEVHRLIMLSRDGGSTSRLGCSHGNWPKIRLAKCDNSAIIRAPVP